MTNLYEAARQVAGDIYRRKSVCFFLGSGAAIDSSLDPNLQLPDGKKIKQYLLKTPGVPDENSLKGVLQVDTLTPEMVWGKVVEVTKYSDGIGILLNFFERSGRNVLPIPSTYRFLAKLVLSQGSDVTLLTTNFDEKLEKAFLEQIRTAHESVKPILITAASNEDFKKLQEDTTGQYPHPILYKLHGTLSRPHTIISTPQRLEPGKKKLLNQVVKRSDVIVFIGYSGSDAGIRAVFKDSLKGVSKPKTRHIYWCKHHAESIIHTDTKLILDNAADMGFTVNYPENVDSHMFLREIWRELNEMHKETITFPTVAEIDKEFCMRRCKDSIPEQFTRLTDPVYGRIQLPGDLSNVIDSGAIQRLRNIKQLSMAYYVFPDATHTRFSHSLGVAHLMNEALEVIRNNKRNSHFKVDDALLFDCVLAGLLHDIGHGPFGHAVEIFMSRLQGRMQQNHEDFTVKFVRAGLLDLDSALNKVHFMKNRVLGLLNGNARLQPEFFALKMLLANKGFDIDRLDFLMRDLYHSGLNIDDMELSEDVYSLKGRKHLVDTIIGNILVSKAQSLPKDQKTGRFPNGAAILCFQDSEQIKKCLDDFFKMYVAMYNRVYYRDVNRMAQAMLGKALNFAFNIGELEIGDIHALTDQELFSYLEQSLDNRVRELTKCVKYRYLFGQTIEFKPQSNIKAQDLETDLLKCLAVEERNVDEMVIVDIAPAKAIDELVYLNEGGKLRRYQFEVRDEKLKGEYEKLKRPRGYVFIPHSLREKASIIQKRLEDL